MDVVVATDAVVVIAGMLVVMVSLVWRLLQLWLTYVNVAIVVGFVSCCGC